MDRENESQIDWDDYRFERGHDDITHMLTYQQDPGHAQNLLAQTTCAAYSRAPTEYVQRRPPDQPTRHAPQARVGTVQGLHESRLKFWLAVERKMFVLLALGLL